MGANDSCVEEPYNITAEEQPSQTAIITKGVFLTIAVTTSFVFNALCLLVLHRVHDRSLNHVTKIFMISFTLCDFFGIIFVYVPMTVSTFMNTWPFGYELCVINGLASTIFAYTSGIQLLAINLERYLAITYPLKWYNIYVTPKRAKIAVIMLWASAFGLSVFAYLLPGRYTAHSPHVALCTSNPCGHVPDVSGTILSSIFAFMPVVLTVFLWLKMYLVARSHTDAIIAQAQSVSHSTPTLDRHDIRRGSEANAIKSNLVDSPTHRKTSPGPGPKSPKSPTARKDRTFSITSLMAFSSTLDRRKSSKVSSRAEQVAVTANRRAFFTFFLMSVCMALFSTPFIIVVVYDNVVREMMPYDYIATAEFLIVSFGFLNVMIYYARNAAFRKTAIKLFTRTASDPYAVKPSRNHHTNGRSIGLTGRDNTIAEV